MTPNLRPQSVALIALAAGVLATLLAWYVTGRSLRLETSAEFANRSQLAASVLERRIQRYVDLLYNLDAFANPASPRAELLDAQGHAGLLVRVSTPLHP